MTKNPLYIVTYDRGQYAVSGRMKPYYWCFFVQDIHKTGGHGIACQLRGMPGAFYFLGAEHIGLDELGVCKEKLEVGEVDLAYLNGVLDILEGLTIQTVKSEP